MIAVLRLQTEAQGVKPGRKLVVFVIALLLMHGHHSEQGGLRNGLESFLR